MGSKCRKNKVVKGLMIPEAIFSGAKIEMISNREITVDGCKGVIDYYENSIKINVSGGTISFNGSNMNISSFFDTVVVINGYIDSVEFCLIK